MNVKWTNPLVFHTVTGLKKGVFRVIFDERHEQILLQIARLDYVTVKQLERMFDLKGRSNKYRVIKQVEPYLNVFKNGRVNVYALNRKGREMISEERVRGSLDNLDHYMMRNDLFVYLGCPVTWEREVRISYTEEYAHFKKRKVEVRADAYYKTDRYHVIEIDNQQRMHTNAKKVEKYRRLIEKGVFKGMPELIWVTRTSYRQHELLSLCDGLDVRVYLWSDLVY